jgi:hypothetical protein
VVRSIHLTLGPGGVCDVSQNKTAESSGAASGAAALCGAAHHGAVCRARHVCTAAGACAEDLALGLPTTMAAKHHTAQAGYSHDFDGASFKEWPLLRLIVYASILSLKLLT